MADQTGRASCSRILLTKFLDSYESGTSEPRSQHYGHYFLGSIILSVARSRTFIIDGQQRLTTLTLLLIYLQRQTRSRQESSSTS